MYTLALDCGGTSTQALLTTTQGKVLGRGQGGPANYTVNGLSTMLRSVGQATKQATEDAKLELETLKSQNLVLALGVSGASREGELEAIIKAFQANGFSQVVADHDASIALLGALSGSDGVAVIAGTGSIAYGLSGEQSSRVGGWGYLLGDEGSGLWIAKQALQQVMQGYDGRLEPDLDLIDAARNYFNVSELGQLIPLIYQQPLDRGFIGGFSKELGKLAQLGNKSSQLILAQAGRELGRLAVAALENLNLRSTQGRVAACGGVFTAGSWILPSMQETIHKYASKQTLTLPDFEPVVGAVLLATRELNLDVKQTVTFLKETL